MTPPSDAARFFDRQGCLTGAGLVALRGAPPGRAPKDVAAHVAACGRCQQRLLSGTHGPAAATPARARRGPHAMRLWWGAIAVLGGLLLLSLAGLAVARWLAR